MEKPFVLNMIEVLGYPGKCELYWPLWMTVS